MESLAASGVAPERARRLARLAITAIEGALILSRVEQSAEPILTTAEEVAELIAAARRGQSGAA